MNLKWSEVDQSPPLWKNEAVTLEEDSVFERRLHGKLDNEKRGNVGVFTSVSTDTQNYLIKCIDSVIQDQIDKEITQSSFLYIQVDEKQMYVQRNNSVPLFVLTRKEITDNPKIWDDTALTQACGLLHDPCHLVKTARNCLFNYGSGQSSRYMWNNGKYLIWRHITGAFQADLDRGLKLLPRLITDHIKLNSY
eukprot:gene17036-8544_t